MAEFKHLVIVKFKEGDNVGELLKGHGGYDLGASTASSSPSGNDSEGREILTQGFTHAFLVTFLSKEDYVAFVSDHKHLVFSPKFSVAIKKVVVHDFPTVVAKSATA